MEKISLVITTKNEEETIAGLLESLMQQTRGPDEVLIVDGGSEDKTVAVIEGFSGRLSELKVIEEPGANISAGRNRGIKEASYDVVAVTDAGCRPDPKWLEFLSAKLEPDTMWCTGEHLTDAQSEFEEVVGKCSTEGYLTVNSIKFKATARNLIFRKEAWEAVGGFPEFLAISEDAFFILKLIEKGYKFEYVPEAKVFWKPRSSFRRIFSQFYRYAYWAARGRIVFKIYWKALLQQLILVLSLVLWLVFKKFYLLLLGLGLIGAYIFRKLRKGSFGPLSIKKIVWMISILFIIQVAISTGSIIGFIHRLFTKTSLAQKSTLI